MTFRYMRLAISILLLHFPFAFTLADVKEAPNEINKQINLLQIYPTTLRMGCTDGSKAREWEFTKEDIYSLSEFSLKTGDSLVIKVDSADIGIGHCKDGAICAMVIPRAKSSLKSSSLNEIESIDHIWFRFHPAEIGSLFPKNTVETAGDKSKFGRMQEIANTKIRGSWQAGGRAMIPGRSDLTVDADTTKDKRRFFVIDNKAGTAKYVDAFEDRTVPKDKPITKALAEDSFDQLCEEYDRNYAMFVLRPEVDWVKLCEKYRPIAINSKTRKEFALVCAEMLKNLRDLHIWVSINGQHVPVYNRPREYNANRAAIPLMIGQLNEVGDKIKWGITSEKVGFISIRSWSGDVDKKFDEALENMRNTRGLIIDVRLNGGGSEPLAKNVAGRFADKEYIYAYSQYRRGSKHTDLTKKYPRSVEPCKFWRYDRPVILLMGQRCMSSNESFISMMGECPQVTTMGDHTCGSSGNPKFVELPIGVRVSLPKWIDFLPDGTPLDEKGVQPDKHFPSKPEFFEGNRDDLLKAAIEQVRQNSLPAKPIPGKSIQDVIADRDKGKASVVSVWPLDGAKGIKPRTEIRIKFDRPMDPLAMELVWKNGKCVEYYSMKYNEKTHEFAFDVELEDETEHHIFIAPDNFLSRIPKGFLTLDGHAPKAFEWKFTTKANAADQDATGDNLGQEAKVDQAREIQLLVEKIKKSRSDLKSVSETVHTVNNHHTKLRSSWAKFKWQGNSQIYANAGNIMSAPYFIGSDGDRCWYYIGMEGHQKLVKVPFEDVDRKNFAICDVFSTSGISSGDSYFNNRFESIKADVIDGHKCYMLHSGMRDVWVDSTSYLPIQIKAEYVPGFTSSVTRRFIYDRVNKLIPDSEFSPESITDLKAQAPKKKSKDYDTINLNVMDSSNGKMSVSWRMTGPKGCYGSGLN